VLLFVKFISFPYFLAIILRFPDTYLFIDTDMITDVKILDIREQIYLIERKHCYAQIVKIRIKLSL